MPRVCLFCEEPDQKLTRQHLLERWILRTYKLHKRSEMNRAIRMVCESCNNTWLSGIESRAKTHVLSMMVGNSDVPLNREAQRAVATWAYKSALLWDRGVPAADGLVFNPGDPPWFRQYERPAPNTFVYIGGVRPKDESFSRVWRGHTEFIAPDSDGRPHIARGFSLTFNIRHLVVQVIGHDFWEELAFEHAGERHGSLVRVWPMANRTLRWPPRLIFDERMLEALSKIAPGRNTRIPPPDRSQYSED